MSDMDEALRASILAASYRAMADAFEGQAACAVLERNGWQRSKTLFSEPQRRLKSEIVVYAPDLASEMWYVYARTPVSRTLRGTE